MRRLKPKFENPPRPWDKARIEREKKIMEEFGLRRKHEIRRAENVLRNFRRQARELIASDNENGKKELLTKLHRVGLVSQNSHLEDVLALKLEDILERRLQTLVYKKGVAKTLKQSRQMITHGHVGVKGVRMIFPAYMVKNDEETAIGLYETSSFKNPKAKVSKETAPEAVA